MVPLMPVPFHRGIEAGVVEAGAIMMRAAVPVPFDRRALLPGQKRTVKWNPPVGLITKIKLGNLNRTARDGAARFGGV